MNPIPGKIDLTALLAKVKRQAALEAKTKKPSSPAERILEDILNWRTTRVVLQELHQTCTCCKGEWISVNCLMVERVNDRTGDKRISMARPDLPHDKIAGLPREKLIITQELPMCPDCFQLQEILDLVRRPQNVGLSCAQMDLFI